MLGWRAMQSRELSVRFEENSAEEWTSVCPWYLAPASPEVKARCLAAVDPHGRAVQVDPMLTPC